MLKLSAGFSRKVGEANYGSRGASVNVELEVESSLISDPEALTGRIRSLFDLARRSVDEELNGSQQDASQQPGANSRKPDNGNDRERVRYATASQVRAIRAIAQKQQLDPVRLANRRFQVNDLEELTLREASSLIDELKANGTAAPKGGGDDRGHAREISPYA